MAQEKQESRSKAAQEKQLSKELEETFPASDPPASTEPGSGITGPEVADADGDHVEAVRRRAHEIWLNEGQPHGKDEVHWRAAEAELAKSR